MEKISARPKRPSVDIVSTTGSRGVHLMRSCLVPLSIELIFLEAQY